MGGALALQEEAISFAICLRFTDITIHDTLYLSDSLLLI